MSSSYVSNLTYLSDKTVSSRQRRVDLRADADEAARYSKLELVVLGKQRDDATEDRTAGDLMGETVRKQGPRDSRRAREKGKEKASHLSFLILLDDSWSDLDLRMLLQDSTEDRTSGHSSFQVLHLFSVSERVKQEKPRGGGRALPGLVDIKGTNNDHARVAREIAAGDGDALGHVLGDLREENVRGGRDEQGATYNVNVVAKLSRDGDDGRLLGDSALDESLDVIVLQAEGLSCPGSSHVEANLLEGRALFDKIDFVLKDDDVLQFHDFHSSKMLCSLQAGSQAREQAKGSKSQGGSGSERIDRYLGLRTRFIASDEQERSIHNGSTWTRKSDDEDVERELVGGEKKRIWQGLSVTVKHRSHKNVVPGTINERNMAK